MAFAVVGLLALICRWAFGRGSSVVERPVQHGEPQQYGLLNPVASPGTYVEAEVQRLRLADGGITSTVAMTNDGPRVMVWPADEARARHLLNAQQQ
jgi:FtsP/CotA-like multicopper oxidase with cupredoxin domain